MQQSNPFSVEELLHNKKYKGEDQKWIVIELKIPDPKQPSILLYSPFSDILTVTEILSVNTTSKNLTIMPQRVEIFPYTALYYPVIVMHIYHSTQVPVLMLIDRIKIIFFSNILISFFCSSVHNSNMSSSCQFTIKVSSWNM